MQINYECGSSIFKEKKSKGGIHIVNENKGLDYKDKNGELRYELRDGAMDMERIESFNALEFYEKLDKVIRTDATKAHKFAKMQLDAKGPMIPFGSYFYDLKHLKENGLEKEFDYLKAFIDCKINIFMITNFIREIENQ